MPDVGISPEIVKTGSNFKVSDNLTPKVLVSESKVRNFELTSSENGKYSKEKKELRSYLEGMGEILPSDHKFTQLVQKVSEKLGVPEQTELMAIDTEDINAFYDPQSKTIVFTRGMCKFFLNQGLDLKEDHIAAVLGHELEHAEVIGDEYVSKIKGSFLERLKSMQRHAEEYRADAEAMGRLSKAGYNPNAVIEILKTTSLTHGRGELAHPEEIERIRKLEDRLADDEHPLSNTSKERTPLDKEMSAWFNGNSDVYSQTEELIHSSSDVLAQKLQKAKTQKEFWEIYDLKKHIDKISAAKTLTVEENQNLERLAVKLMVYEAFCGKEPFVNGQPIRVNPLINNSLINEEGGISKEEHAKVFHMYDSFSEGSNITRLFKSSEFRQSVPQELPLDISLDSARADIVSIEGLVDKAIKGRLGLVSTKPLSEDEKMFYDGLKNCSESGQASQDLLLTLYSSLDLQHQTSLQQASSQQNQERGLRSADTNNSNLLNLRDVNVRTKVLDQIKFALASRLIKGTEPSSEIINLFEKTICHDTGLSQGEAGILAKTIFERKDASRWAEYLRMQSKESLKRITKDVQVLDEGYKKDLKFSPFRSFHQSYLTSESQIKSSEPWSIYASGGEYGLDAHGLTVLKMLPGNVLYRKGWPTQFDNAWKKPSPAEINLSLDEWDAVVEGHGDHGAESTRDIFVLKQYVAKLKNKELISEELRKHLKSPSFGAYASESLDAKELSLLIENSPWDLENLKKNIGVGIAHLPYGSDNPEARKEILKTLKLSYELFKDEKDTASKAHSISSRMLKILTQEFESGLPQNEALKKAIIHLSDQNVSLDYKMFFTEIKSGIWQLQESDIADLLNYFKQKNNLDSSQSDLVENLIILSQIPLNERAAVQIKPITANLDHFYNPESGEVYCKESLQAITSNHGEDAVKWILENIPPSERYTRDRFLIGLIYNAPAGLQDKYIREAEGNFINSPDRYEARKSSSFPFQTYYAQAHDVRFYTEKDRTTVMEGFQARGKLKENFPDLLARRFPFATHVFVGNPGRFHGSYYQRFQAYMLSRSETDLFDKTLNINERTKILIKIAPYPSAVRDIHLELLLKDELINNKNDQEKIKAGNALLPLFTEKSSLKEPLAIQVFKSELVVCPRLAQDFDAYIDTLTRYMPEPSLARNYFLSQLEASAPLTVKQLKQIISMRMSSEGKKTEDDSAPVTFVLDKLGELNREERIKTTLWLLGMSPQKPKTVLKIEENFDGHLNNFPNAIAMETSDEREVTYKKLFLGAEGIVDLDAVKPEQFSIAEKQRKEFIKTLAENMLPDTMPRAQLFRNIFSTVIESSDPPHASRLLIKLINKFSEAKAQGKQLPPEEVIAIGLNELGVVGKKVSQSLAEMDWVPDSYKKTLKRAQTEGEIVPKRALLTLAEDAGLTNENSQLEITSFNDLIGAASNKQAALLSIEVHDESVGLPRGSHNVVGKFKRPSAQKTENINHDLRVLKGILEILNKEGYGDTLPKDFSAQISNAVKRELEFTQEKRFSEELKIDLDKRNAKRKTKVSIPRIYYASDDVMMESVAPGISLRNYKDLRGAGYDQLLTNGYGSVSERIVNQAVVTEALAQLITTGNVHADLHPGNIFVDKKGDLTLIDLGMHEKLNYSQRLNTISLIAGLTVGNETYVKRTLKNLGWDLEGVKLDLGRFNFGQNTTQLLKASKKASVPPPELLSSIILATSKLTTYTEGFSNAELFRMLVSAIDKKEAPRIITHLMRTGGKDFLSFINRQKQTENNPDEI